MPRPRLQPRGAGRPRQRQTRARRQPCRIQGRGAPRRLRKQPVEQGGRDGKAVLSWAYPRLKTRGARGEHARKQRIKKTKKRRGAGGQSGRKGHVRERALGQSRAQKGDGSAPMQEGTMQAQARASRFPSDDLARRMRPILARAAKRQLREDIRPRAWRSTGRITLPSFVLSSSCMAARLRCDTISSPRISISRSRR